MEKEIGLAGAILAGGKSIRMGGQEKGFIRVGGIPLIRRTIDLLEKLFEEIILITNVPEDFKDYSNRIIITSDIVKDVGPLGGIHSGLCRTSKEAVFFVACDMPFLKCELIQREIGYFKRMQCDALVPRMGELIEPIHAVYKKSLSKNLHNFLETGSNYSIRNFLDRINVRYFELEDNQSNREIFVNLNTHRDLKMVRINK